MRKLKLVALLLSLSVSTAYAGWCGYSEFIHGANSQQEMVQILLMRSGFCNRMDGGMNLIKDGQKCYVSNAQIGNNLESIVNNVCPSDPKMCAAAFNALQYEMPGTNNIAYWSIFDKCN